MKKVFLLTTITLGFYLLISFVFNLIQPGLRGVYAQRSNVALSESGDLRSASGITPAKVDFDAYEMLLQEAKIHRQKRMVTLDEFLKMSRDPNTIILDTRSDVMYRGKHIKGAVHLNFSDFTQENLARMIPSIGTRILIYCNNNFEGDRRYFASKSFEPEMLQKALSVSGAPGNKIEQTPALPMKAVTLALNIPTFINLYGYGYRNVYELSELVWVTDPRIQFEGANPE